MADEGKKLAVRKRTAAKGWLTRSSTALSKLLQRPDVTRWELEDAVSDFDQRLATFDDAQAAMELELDEPTELKADIEAADIYRRGVRVPRRQATQKLAELLQPTESQGV